MSDNELDVEDIDEMSGNEQHRRTTDDWVAKHWPQLVGLVIVVIAFGTLKADSANHNTQINDLKTILQPLASISAKVNNNESKNLLTYNNVETVKIDLMPKLSMIKDNQTRMLTLIESFSQIYPTKEYLSDKLSKVVANFRIELDKKVGYDRIDKRHLKD